MFESFKPRFDAIIDLNKPITTLFGNMNKNSTFVIGKKAFYFLNHIL